MTTTLLITDMNGFTSLLEDDEEDLDHFANLSTRQHAVTDPLLRPTTERTHSDSNLQHDSTLIVNNRKRSHKSYTPLDKTVVALPSNRTRNVSTPTPLSLSKELTLNTTDTNTTTTTTTNTPKIKAPLFDDEKFNDESFSTFLSQFLEKKTITQKKDSNETTPLPSSSSAAVTAVAANKSYTSSPLLSNKSGASTGSNWAIDKESLGIKQDECPICLDEIEVSERSYLPCSHYFHQECVSQCMSVIITNGCPLCRIPIMSEEDRLSEELVRQLSLEEE